jgi:adenosinetriphosphatase
MPPRSSSSTSATASSPGRGGTSTDAFVEDITNAFLPMWDGLESSGQIWVVGATNKRDRIDEAIDSRFGEKIEIGLPDAPERLRF